MVLRFLLCLTLLSTAWADEWSLSSPLEGQTGNFGCPRTVGTGSFELSAKLQLKVINGTAASLWFGNELNFGFDSGKGMTLFVENGGEVRLLEEASKWITAGKSFTFQAKRDAAGETVFSIDQKEVCRTGALAGKALAVTFRPHRNMMDILKVTLKGDLRPSPPPLEARAPVVPILVGCENVLMEITLLLEQSRILSGIDIVSDASDLLLVDESMRRHGLDEPLELRAGEHHFQIAGMIAPEINLLTVLGTKGVVLKFADGGKLEARRQATHRLAFPIHRQGEVGCHTTRIPALAKSKKGTLLGAYDLRHNGPKDLQEDIDIGLSRSTDGGQTWEAPRAIIDMGEYGGKPQNENGVSDPNILVDPDTGRIFVSAVWTYGKPNTHQWKGNGSEPGFEIGDTAQFMVVTSDDDGVTWSAPQNWTRKLKQEEWWLFAPAPGNGIALDDGTLVMSTQGRDKDGFPFSNLMWSRDHGATWTLGSAARDDTSECAVAQLSGGALLLSMRDNRNRALKGDTNGRALGVTRDLGKTWEVHPGDHLALPEPVCMASLISHKLPDGRHVLLFSNPHDKYARKNITIQISHDDGKTWPKRVLLDEGTGGGYSSLVMVDDGMVGILYESSRANLVFQKIPLKELL